MSNVQLAIEKKVTEAAGNSAAQVLADEKHRGSKCSMICSSSETGLW